MFLGILTLFSALCLSITAAAFSLYGLMDLFPGSTIAITIMGGAMELAKIVATIWLHNNWHNKSVTFFLKTYLSISIIILMIITSTGIYGYLSMSHLEATNDSKQTSLSISHIENKISTEQDKIARNNKTLDLLDKNLDTFLKNDRATQANQTRQAQQKERNKITSEIKTSQKTVETLENELYTLKNTHTLQTEKLGPVKYVAQLFFDNYQDNIDKAVRIIILLLIFVFDPLAILLAISANISFADYFKKKKMQQVETRDNYISRSQDGVTLSPNSSKFEKVNIIETKTPVYSSQEIKEPGPKTEILNNAPFIPMEELKPQEEPANFETKEEISDQNNKNNTIDWKEISTYATYATTEQLTTLKDKGEIKD